MARLLKQLVYLIVYLLIFTGIAYLLYLYLSTPPASCTNNLKDANEEGADCGGICSKICLPSDFTDIQAVGEVSFFKSAPDQIAVLAKIQNSNANVAARSFHYSFDLKDVSGGKITSLGGDSYIYPGEIKYLAAFGRTDRLNDVVDAGLALSNQVWIRGADFARPMIGFPEQRTEQGPTGIQALGRISNKDVINLGSIEIFAVFKDTYGNIAGVSKTGLDRLGPGETKDFSIFHPNMPGLDKNRTELTASALRAAPY